MGISSQHRPVGSHPVNPRPQTGTMLTGPSHQTVLGLNAIDHLWHPISGQSGVRSGETVNTSRA